ncbi:TPM domain-containing protein [Candidatus Nitrospira salsa]
MMFSEEDHTRIREAVTKAEQGTRGEIVPMIVERSARYREAWYRSGIGCAFFVLTLLLTVELEWMPWGWHPFNAAWLLLMTVMAYVGGYWLGTIPPVTRFLTSDDRMAYKVSLRAHQAFLEHGLHRTELGTGVLIMVSLLEHRIEILTDRPLLDHVPQERWDRMVSVIREGFQKGNPVQSLCHAIALCGDVLAEVYPSTANESNPNELSNKLLHE